MDENLKQKFLESLEEELIKEEIDAVVRQQILKIINEDKVSVVELRSLLMG